MHSTRSTEYGGLWYRTTRAGNRVQGPGRELKHDVEGRAFLLSSHGISCLTPFCVTSAE